MCYFTHFLYFFVAPLRVPGTLGAPYKLSHVYSCVTHTSAGPLSPSQRSGIPPHLPSLSLREREREREERGSAVSSPATNAFVGHFKLRKRVWWQQNCSFCSSVGPKIYITGQEMSPELVVLGGRNFSFAPCLIPLLEYRRPYTSEPYKNS